MTQHTLKSSASRPTIQRTRKHDVEVRVLEDWHCDVIGNNMRDVDARECEWMFYPSAL